MPDQPDDKRARLETPEAVQVRDQRETTIEPRQGGIQPTIREGHRPVRSPSLLRLPEGLSSRFHIVEHLPTAGSEADLLVVANDADERYVVKLYRPHIEPKSEVLAAISQASPEHVVRLYENGVSDGVWYELLEYVRFGSLRDIISSGPADDDHANEILHELAIAISHLHQKGIIHRDLKPENILVRTPNPLDLVFADFGIASLAAGTVHFTSSSRTIRYGAPESASGVIGPAVDYWALGMVMVEVIAGRHPFEGLSDAVINSQLATRSVDLANVRENWRPLCRGLLVRDPKNRWAESQVDQWLGGERNIPVADDVIVSHRPFPFMSVEYDSLAKLLEAFAQNWDEAVKRVERGNLSDWLQKDVRDFDAFNFVEDLRNDNAIDKNERLFLVITHFCPRLPPMWKGHSLDRESLIALADPEKGAADLLHEVYSHRLLSKYDASVGSSSNAELDRLWIETALALQQQWKNLGTAGGPWSRKPAEPWLTAAALLSATKPEFVAQLRASSKQWVDRGAERCRWFAALGDTPAGLITKGIVGDAAVEEVELADRIAESERLARLAETERRSRELRYERAEHIYALSSQWSAGALLGLVAGFVPCWIFTGIVGWIGGYNVGWVWFWLLWLACAVGGVLYLGVSQVSRGWVANSSANPIETRTNGLLITVPCVLVIIGSMFLAIREQIMRPTWDIIGIAYFANGQQSMQPVTYFSHQDSIYFRFSYNYKISLGSAIVREELYYNGNNQPAATCNPISLPLGQGWETCGPWLLSQSGNYELKLSVNGTAIGRYPLTFQ